MYLYIIVELIVGFLINDIVVDLCFDDSGVFCEWDCFNYGIGEGYVGFVIKGYDYGWWVYVE